jgi:hypothetical protein
VIKDFTASKHCTSRAHCATCRADAAWRASVGAPEVCPHTGSIRLGDLIERLAKPIAKALALPCLDSTGQLKPESPCAKRRDALNRLL